MEQPNWATTLIAEVMAHEKRSRFPKIEWRRSNYGSSGVTHRSSDWKGHFRKNRIWLLHPRKYAQKPDITIRMKEGSAHRGLLLHELAHWLIRSGHHHDMVFWRKAWSLYFRFLTPEEIEKYKPSEFAYKGKAKIAYEQMTGLSA